MAKPVLDFQIKIEDFGLAKRVGKEPGKAMLSVTAATRAWAELIARYAKANLVPGRGRRTGTLANSISVQQSGKGALVGPSVFYGTFVEFGTGTRGIGSVDPDALKAFGLGQGDYGSRAGMNAQHYLWRAYKSSLKDGERLLKAAGKKIIRDIAK